MGMEGKGYMRDGLEELDAKEGRKERNEFQ